MSTKQQIADLKALNETISAQLPGTEDPRYVELVTAKALLSIAASLASIDLYGIETSERN